MASLMEYKIGIDARPMSIPLLSMKMERFAKHHNDERKFQMAIAGLKVR